MANLDATKSRKRSFRAQKIGSLYSFPGLYILRFEGFVCLLALQLQTKKNRKIRIT